MDYYQIGALKVFANLGALIEKDEKNQDRYGKEHEDHRTDPAGNKGQHQLPLVRDLGSRASRTASPYKFNEAAVSAIRIPGATPTIGRV